jgi:outer membrane protein TolC
MQLTDAQKTTVAQWVKAKRSIAEIQKLLAQEFSISMTYMDVRFLLIDLGLEVQDQERKDFKRAEIGKVQAGPAGEQFGPPASGRAAGGVSVSMDRVMKPGALASGTVTFSDGVTASWLLDELGRLALDSGKRRYRPSREDLDAFQREISQELQKHGF